MLILKVVHVNKKGHLWPITNTVFMRLGYGWVVTSHNLLYDVITNPCHNCNNSSAKAPLKAGHGWLFTLHIFMWWNYLSMSNFSDDFYFARSFWWYICKLLTEMFSKYPLCIFGKIVSVHLCCFLIWIFCDMIPYLSMLLWFISCLHHPILLKLMECSGNNSISYKILIISHGNYYEIGFAWYGISIINPWLCFFFNLWCHKSLVKTLNVESKHTAYLHET